MKFSKPQRSSFNAFIDMLLASADKAKVPDRKRIHAAFVEKGRGYEAGVLPKFFPEAEVFADGVDVECLEQIQGSYGDAVVFGAADPRSDLPRKYDTSMVVVTKGLAQFYGLRSVALSQLRGHKLRSPWVAKLRLFTLDLDSFEGVGDEQVVYWTGDRWRSYETISKSGWNELAGAYSNERFYEYDPEAVSDTCNILAGLTFSRDCHWRVVIKTPLGQSFSIITDSVGAAAAFADRSGDTPSGRRPALRNWVASHARLTRRSGDDGKEILDLVSVRKHLRGRVPFKWCGFDCELVVAPFDMRHNERLANQTSTSRRSRRSAKPHA